MAYINVKINGSISDNPAVSQGNTTKYGTKVWFGPYEPGKYEVYAEESYPDGTLRGKDTAEVKDAKIDVDLPITLKD
jgi:hypothetical protein